MLPICTTINNQHLDPPWPAHIPINNQHLHVDPPHHPWPACITINNQPLDPPISYSHTQLTPRLYRPSLVGQPLLLKKERVW